MNGVKTIKDETETVATTITGLLDRPPANDENMRQRA